MVGLYSCSAREGRNESGGLESGFQSAKIAGESPMKRLLTLWLTLLGAFWLTRAAASALIFERIADQGGEALFLLIAVPLLQTLAVGWLTRPPEPPAG